MKKAFLIIAIFIAGTCSLMAQTKTSDMYKQQLKEHEALQKYSDKIMETKISKAAKKEAKRLKKEGWKPFPGDAPLETQIIKRLRLETLTEGSLPKYIIGTSIGLSDNLQVAKNIADIGANSEILTQFKSTIKRIEDQTENSTQAGKNNASIVETVTKYAGEAESTLFYNLPIVKMYMENNDGNYRVSITKHISTDQAMLALLEKVKAQNAELGEQFEKSIKNK